MATELTPTEAAKSLTYYDRRAIKKEFGVSMSDDNLDELDFVTAIAWIVETRANPSAKPDEFKRMSAGEIENYFASDDADPLDSKSEKTQIATSPNGASIPGNLPAFTAS